MSKYLIFGNGWIGNRLLELLPDAIISDLNITDAEAIEESIRSHEPEVVINAAGKTGRPNIDWCETNRQATFESNVLGAGVVADACSFVQGVKLVHISSGCLWPHGVQIPEDRNPEPPSYYSVTKEGGEALVSTYNPSALILRIRMPIDIFPHERNLITKLVGYETILSEPQSITPVHMIAEAIEHLCEQGECGVFNVVSRGEITAKEIIEMYESEFGVDLGKTYISANEFEKSGLATAGRSNCTLSVDKLAATGLGIVDARPSVMLCVSMMHSYLSSES